jgi:hypothetical protein
MSGTIRTILPPYPHGKYEQKDIDRMRHGLVNVPKPETNKSGIGKGYDEVWGERGKRYNKKLHHKVLRNQNKKVLKKEKKELDI